MSERHYWDTCAWIDLINEPAAPIGPMRTMWGSVERGGLEVLFSPITLAECLFRADGEERPYTDPHPSDELFDASGVIPVQVDRVIGEAARSLRRRHNLSTPDAIHVACAAEYSVTQLVTRDGSVLTKLPRLYCKDGSVLVISTPREALGGPLFQGRN